jgi:hypothetical protein
MNIIWFIFILSLSFPVCAEVVDLHVFREKGFSFTIDNTWKIVTEQNDPQELFIAQWLADELLEKTGLDLRYSIVDMQNMPASNRILLGLPQYSSQLSDVMDIREIAVSGKLGDQGFKLEIYNTDPREIILAANENKGLFFGVNKLVKHINTDNTITGVSIEDFPDHNERIMYLDASTDLAMSDDPPIFGDTQKSIIDRCARQNITTIINATTAFNTHMWQSDLAYWLPYQEMAEYCEERFIRYIPSTPNVKAHKAFDFEYVEGRQIKNESFTFDANDYAVPDRGTQNLFSQSLPQTIYTSQSIVNDVPITASSSIQYYGIFISLVSLAGENAGATLEAVLENNGETVSTKKISFSAINTYPKRSGFSVTIDPSMNIDNIKFTIKCTAGSQVEVQSVDLYCMNTLLKNIKESSVVVKNLAGTVVYTPDVDYTITPGDTDKVFYFTFQPFKIKRITGGAISQGQSVLVTYDTVIWDYYSSGNTYPGPCLSNPQLYSQLFFPAIDRIVQYLHPEFINFGADEVGYLNMDSVCVDSGKSNAELLLNFMTNVSRYTKQVSPGTRSMFSHDMMSPYHNGNYNDNNNGSTSEILNIMDESDKPDWIIIIWKYNEWGLDKLYKQVKLFSDNDLDYFTASWSNLNIVKKWACVQNTNHYLGHMNTAFGNFTDFIEVFSDIFWNTGQKEIYHSGFEDTNVDDNCKGWTEISSIPKVNIIQNGSFEQNLNSWTIEYTDSNTPTIVSDEKYDEQYALYVKNDGYGANISSDFIPIDNSMYDFSIWAKGNNISCGTYPWFRLYVLARLYDSSYNEMFNSDISTILTGTFDWTNFVATFTVPEGAEYLKIKSLGIISNGRGEGWLDNVSLIRVTGYNRSGKYCFNGPDNDEYECAAFLVRGSATYGESDLISVPASNRLEVNSYVKRLTTGGTANPRIGVKWFDADEVELSSGWQTSALADVSSGFTLKTVQIDSPDNAAFVKLRLMGSDSANDIFSFDNISILREKFTLPIVHQDFNDDQTTNLINLSGNDIVLYNYGADLVEGIKKLSADFNYSQSDQIVIENSEDIRLDKDLSLAFWIKPKNLGLRRENPLDKCADGEFALTLERDGVGGMGKGRLTYYHGDGTPEPCFNWIALPFGTVKNDEWQHIVITRDSATHQLCSYYNGVLMRTGVYGDAPAKLPSYSDYDILIGSGYCGTFDGYMDDVMIFDKILSPADIERMQNRIEDGSFENGLSAFSVSGSVTVSDDSIDGEHSLCFDGGSSYITSDYIPVKPGTDYVLSTWAKGENIVTGGLSYHRFYMICRWYDQNKTQISGFPDLTVLPVGTFDWGYYSTPSMTAPSGAAYFKISSGGLIGGATGRAWLDLLTFRKE